MDDRLIRISLPQLSAERRGELNKLAAQYAESAKQSIRHIRHDAMEAVKQVEKAEDTRRLNEEEIQKITDEFSALVEEHLKFKQKDIATI
jgi:ribosome recycling factor